MKKIKIKFNNNGKIQNVNVVVKTTIIDKIKNKLKNKFNEFKEIRQKESYIRKPFINIITFYGITLLWLEILFFATAIALRHFYWYINLVMILTPLILIMIMVIFHTSIPLSKDYKLMGKHAIDNEIDSELKTDSKVHVIEGEPMKYVI